MIIKIELPDRKTVTLSAPESFDLEKHECKIDFSDQLSNNPSKLPSNIKNNTPEIKFSYNQACMRMLQKSLKCLYVKLVDGSISEQEAIEEIHHVINNDNQLTASKFFTIVNNNITNISYYENKNYPLFFEEYCNLTISVWDDETAIYWNKNILPHHVELVKKIAREASDNKLYNHIIDVFESGNIIAIPILCCGALERGEGFVYNIIVTMTIVKNCSLEEAEELFYFYIPNSFKILGGDL